MLPENKTIEKYLIFKRIIIIFKICIKLNYLIFSHIFVCISIDMYSKINYLLIDLITY